MDKKDLAQYGVILMVLAGVVLLGIISHWSYATWSIIDWAVVGVSGYIGYNLYK